MKEIDGGYYEYSCSKCNGLARNTYSEPYKTDMLQRKLCWTCNFWVEQDQNLAVNHARMTIIEGHIYTLGNRTSGSFRGMAGRRFDIEYIAPSTYAGKKITTFDLWSGSTMPKELQDKYPDTARFLNNAERVSYPKGSLIEGCWNPSESREAPFPLPRDVGIA